MSQGCVFGGGWRLGYFEGTFHQHTKRSSMKNIKQKKVIWGWMPNCWEPVLIFAKFEFHATLEMLGHGEKKTLGKWNVHIVWMATPTNTKPRDQGATHAPQEGTVDPREHVLGGWPLLRARKMNGGENTRYVLVGFKSCCWDGVLMTEVYVFAVEIYCKMAKDKRRMKRCFSSGKMGLGCVFPETRSPPGSSGAAGCNKPQLEKKWQH